MFCFVFTLSFLIEHLNIKKCGYLKIMNGPNSMENNRTLRERSNASTVGHVHSGGSPSDLPGAPDLGV